MQFTIRFFCVKWFLSKIISVLNNWFVTNPDIFTCCSKKLAECLNNLIFGLFTAFKETISKWSKNASPQVLNKKHKNQLSAPLKAAKNHPWKSI